jgi:hypothetical protein
MPGANTPATPEQGLLASIAPLAHLSWQESFAIYLGLCRQVLAGQQDDSPPDQPDGRRIRNLLMRATRRPIQQFLAGQAVACSPIPALTREPATRATDGLRARLASSLARPGLVDSHLASLLELKASHACDLLVDATASLRHIAADSPGLEYLEVESCICRGKYPEAFSISIAGQETSGFHEHEGFRLRQLAKVATQWGRPALALPWLGRWLECYPDSPDSGDIWFEHYKLQLAAGNTAAPRAYASLIQARRLLGRQPYIIKAEKLIRQWLTPNA